MRSPLAALGLALAASSTAAAAQGEAPRSAEPPAPGSYRIRSGDSELTYQVRHPLHEVRGVTRDVRGTLEIGPAAPWLRLPARVWAPLTAFSSRNRNRDANALAALGAHRYPEAAVRVTALDLAPPEPGGAWAPRGTASGELALHGMVHPFQARLDVMRHGPAGLAVEAAFAFSLGAFGVERPALLLLPVDDQVAVRCRLVASP